MQQRTISLSCSDWLYSSVLLSALHPNLRTCDGSKYAGSAHTSVIPMFCGSVTEEALVRTYVNGTPACSDAKSVQLGARNVASVCGDKARLSTMDLRTAGWAEPYRDTRGCLHLSPNWVTDLDGLYTDATTRPCNDIGGCCCPQYSGSGTINASYLRIKTDPFWGGGRKPGLDTGRFCAHTLNVVTIVIVIIITVIINSEWRCINKGNMGPEWISSSPDLISTTRIREKLF